MKTSVVCMTAVMTFIVPLGFGACGGRSAQFVSHGDAKTMRGGGNVCVDPANWVRNAASGIGCSDREGWNESYQTRAKCPDPFSKDQECICTGVSQGWSCFVGSGACGSSEFIFDPDAGPNGDWVNLHTYCMDVFFALANAQQEAGCTTCQ